VSEKRPVTVTLRPMTVSERRTWIQERGIPGYAVDIVRAGVLGEEAARRKAEADYAGLDTADGVAWRHAEADVDGAPTVVGGVAWRVEPAHGEPMLYVMDVEVFTEYRGRGLGRALMAAVIGQARSLGARRVGLTVWQGNDVALSLYESLGMTVINRSMVLDLDPTR
jgi:ribosomal protein S18 acetylase RimI-like enzyme